ncbi:MAG: DNA polymerase-3 subunit gamma/tau [Bacteroidia bacterium]|jgi:DNA polymerase-3 subunit gamma/tau
MENFVVSARKYRPTSFSKVVGQEHVTQTLLNEIKNNQLAQAFLFNGPRGVGKTTCARILAKEINKESVEDSNYDYSYNIFELDAASNNSVEDIRLLNEQVRIPPQVGKYKVYIIDEVHMLSAAAFNAFLKTLEEPPSYAIFILATTERHKILPTILSRCQVFNFNRIGVTDMAKHLQGIADAEQVKVEEEALHIIAQKADGALRDALSIFDQMVSVANGSTVTYQSVIDNLNVLDYEYYFKILDGFNNQDISSVLIYFDEILNKGFDGQIFLNGLASHFRDLMVSKDPKTVQLLQVPAPIKSKYLSNAETLSMGFLVNAIHIANQFDSNYKSSRNQRLHVELALIKMCYLPALLEGGEKKNDDQQQLAPAKQNIPVLTGPTKEKETNSVPEVPKKIEQPAISNELPSEKIKKYSTSEASQKVAKLGNLEQILAGNKGAQPIMAEPEIKKNGQEMEPPSPSDRVGEANIDEINRCMEQYSASLQEAKRNSLHSIFKLLQPKLAGNEFSIDVNKQHRIQMEEIRVEFQQYLRNELNMSELNLNLIEVKKKAKGQRAYTNIEKFEAMAVKNPNLKKLREDLNLEFE